MRPVLVCLVLALAVPATALAHGEKPVIPDAVAGLRESQIYVDFDAEPSLTEQEADALGRRLAAKPGVYVAVLPGSASEELGANPDGVAREIGKNVGRDGIYVVSAGGRIGTWPGGAASVATSGGLAARLTAIVDGLHLYYVEDSRSTWWWIALGAAIAATLTVAAAILARRRQAARSG